MWVQHNVAVFGFSVFHIPVNYISVKHYLNGDYSSFDIFNNGNPGDKRFNRKPCGNITG